MLVTLIRLFSFLLPTQYFVQHPNLAPEMLSVKKIKLNDGILVPMLAYGTSTAIYQKDCSRWVRMAYLDAGVTHFDCAESYGNEHSLGKAVKELGVP